MARRDIEYIKIPPHYLPIIGEVDEGTRMYRAYSSDVSFMVWWDAVCEICGEDSSVSPGGVSMYVKVSRAGVHKRMKEGRLTAFLFHDVKGKTLFTNREKLGDNGYPYIYIPGCEVHSWAEIHTGLSKKEALREALGDGDFRGEFTATKGRKLPKDK